MQVELIVPPTPKLTSKGHSKMFPVLVFLLTACYGILTLVVIEQGRVVQSQRNLIGQLMQDSQQLTSLKGQEAAQRAIDKKHSKAGAMSKTKPQASSAASPDREQTPKVSRRSRVEKQPMQAVDKVDRRRFPAQI